MILQVNADWRIASDPLQWIIQRRRHHKGTDTWRSVSYHRDLGEACFAVAGMQVRAIPGTTPALEALEALHDALAGIRADISAALDGLDTDPARCHDTDRVRTSESDGPTPNGNVVRLPLGDRVA